VAIFTIIKSEKNKKSFISFFYTSQWRGSTQGVEVAVQLDSTPGTLRGATAGWGSDPTRCNLVGDLSEGLTRQAERSCMAIVSSYREACA